MLIWTNGYFLNRGYDLRSKEALKMKKCDTLRRGGSSCFNTSGGTDIRPRDGVKNG